jgi:hypothetical protein
MLSVRGKNRLRLVLPAVLILLLLSAAALHMYTGLWKGSLSSLPSEKQLHIAPLGEIRHYPTSVSPAVAPFTIKDDLSNVEDAEGISFLSPAERKLLATNGFVMRTTPGKDMYELYEPNPAPFVTADCVFHAYHVLLFDTLQSIDEVYLSDQLLLMVAGAHKSLRSIHSGAAKALQPAARAALLHFAVAHRLADPAAGLDASVKKEVLDEVARLDKAQVIGALPGEQRPRDYTIYKPVAGYESKGKLQRYFRAHRFLSSRPIRFDDAEGARACVLSAAALWSKRRTRRAYINIARLSRLLAGEPEDPTPLEVLRVARSVFGDAFSIEKLAEKNNGDALARKLAALPRPAIADQPQVEPGADPSLGRGMRVFSPGVTIRARAFQALGEKTVPLSGEHIAHVLGNESLELPPDRQALLKPARRLLDDAKARMKDGLDIHTMSLVTLSELSSARGRGYPSFMNSDAWRLKTANAQMAAWSQVEHDTFLYAKDNAYYMGIYDKEVKFPGYVEPVPAYYAALTTLVHRTRTAFEELGVFSRIARLREEGDRHAPSNRCIVVTAKHYRTLEDILVKLKSISEKELEDKALSRSEVELLGEFGLKLKYLAFNESNVPYAHEPMSTIVRIAREYLERKGLYVGTGRPFQIIAIVPWQGKLHWASGATYSYYEFLRPLGAPLTDAEWKRETSSCWPCQDRRPWLFGRGLGIDEKRWSVERFKSWLPKEEDADDFGCSRGGFPDFLGIVSGERLDFFGFVVLDEGAAAAASEAFSRGHYGEYTRDALYLLLRGAPRKVRKRTGLSALSRILAELNKEPDATDSCNYRRWILAALMLVRDMGDDPGVDGKVREMRLWLEQTGDIKPYREFEGLKPLPWRSWK